MRKLMIGAIALGALLLALLIVGSTLAAQLHQPTAAELAADYAQATKIAQDAQLDAAWAPARAAAWNLVLIITPIAIALIGIGYLGAQAVAHARFRFRHARPDGRGLVDVPIALLPDVGPQALGAYHAARQLEAGRQAVPHTLTYSPAEHYAPRLDYRREPERAALAAPAEPAGELAQLPGLTDLADVGFTPSVDRILLGLGPDRAPITVPMRQLWHIALAGPTGNGKSNIARLIVAQLLSLNAQVCIGDPKWTEYDAEQDEDWRPIARRLAREPAYSAKAIGALLDWAAAPEKGELARRIARRRQGERAGPPIFLYLDELPWIAAHVDGAEARIGELVRVGRGVGIFLLIGAQDLLSKTVNLSAERDNFRTGFYLGGDDTTGAILLGIPKREVSEPAGLGVAWLRSTATTPAQQVRIPYASNRAIAGLLGEPAPASSLASQVASSTAPDLAREVEGEVRMEAGASGALTLSARDRHILALVRQQKGVSEIISEVWGVKGGSKYSAYSAEVMRVIALALGQGQGV